MSDEIVERMRGILLQATDKWKTASDFAVVETALDLLDTGVMESNSMYDLYVAQYEFLFDIEHIISDELECAEKIVRIQELIRQWREFA